MASAGKFDNFGVEDMSREEFDKKQADVLSKCKCAGCPSFVEGDDAAGFCFPMIGTSNVIHKENGCLCSTCPVYGETELNHSFYCTRCSQVCQSYKMELGGGHE